MECRDSYISWQRRYGRYGRLAVRTRVAWWVLEAWTAQHLPAVRATLRCTSFCSSHAAMRRVEAPSQWLTAVADTRCLCLTALLSCPASSHNEPQSAVPRRARST